MHHPATILRLLSGLAALTQTMWAAPADLEDKAKTDPPKISASNAAAPVAGENSVKPEAIQARVSEAMVILRKNCLACHNEEKKKGELVMVTREALLKGSENGPVVVPGKAGESLLSKVLLPEADPHMPPKKQLSDNQIVALRAWIDDGVKWDEKALAESPPPVVSPDQLHPLPDTYQPVLAIQLSTDGKRLAVGRGHSVCIYDVGQTNLPLVARLAGGPDVVQSLAWSPDGKWLGSGGFRRLSIWDAETLQPNRALTNLVGRVTALAFTPDSTMLVAADGEVTQNGLIHLCAVKDFEAITNWMAHADTILDLEVSPDGKWLATASVDKLVKIWELPSGKEIAKLEGHTGHVWSLAFKPDGSLLASGSADKDVKIWDLKTKELKQTVGRHPASVTALVWNRDGKQIVSCCEDGSVRLCEESKDSPVRTFSGVGDVLYATAVSADGKSIYGGGHDGLVYVWGADGKLKNKLEDSASEKKLVAR